MRYDTIYAQRDPQWRDELLGGLPGATIGTYGCLLCCFAMVATAAGQPTTPAALNVAFEAAGAYLDGDLLADFSLELAVPDCAWHETLHYEHVPADLARLRTVLADPATAVILELDWDHDLSDGLQSHFVVAAACVGEPGTGADVTIADPWWGDVAPMTDHYGPEPAAVIQKAIVYRVTGGPADMTPDEQQLLVLLASRQITTPQALEDVFTWGDQAAQDVEALRAEVSHLRDDVLPTLEQHAAALDQETQALVADLRQRLQTIEQLANVPAVVTQRNSP